MPASDQLHHVDNAVLITVEQIIDGCGNCLRGRAHAVGAEQVNVGLVEHLLRELPLLGDGLEGLQAHGDRDVLQAASRAHLAREQRFF